MRVLRGTLRLSVVIAILALGYGVIAAHMAAHEDAAKGRRLWSVLTCAKRFLDRDMAPFTNEYGNIDIGKAGCASEQFLATKYEIRDALTQTDPYDERYWPKLQQKLQENTLSAVLIFILINLAAVLFIAIRRVGHWIWQGYRRQV